MTIALTELLHGQGAHVDPIACLEDLEADLAARHTQGFPHSIADLVFHMNYWMAYELTRIRGEHPHYPEHNAESFPRSQAVDSEQWNSLRKRFISLLAELKQLAQSPPTDLARELESIHEGDKKVSGTLESVLWQMVAHNSYHLGQIALLRRALNAWPPKSGGDTW